MGCWYNLYWHIRGQCLSAPLTDAYSKQIMGYELWDIWKPPLPLKLWKWFLGKTKNIKHLNLYITQIGVHSIVSKLYGLPKRKWYKISMTEMVILMKMLLLKGLTEYWKMSLAYMINLKISYRQRSLPNKVYWNIQSAKTSLELLNAYA